MKIPRVFTITEKLEETPGTFTLNLTAQDQEALPSFRPGQFNMLFSFGGGEVPISLSGSPSDNSKWTHTIRAVGSVTQGLAHLRIGDSLGIRGPFGCGWPLEKARGLDLIIVAGGLGLAPLRPVIYQCLAKITKTKSIRLFYGARGPEEVLFLDECEKWSEKFPVNITVDHADKNWKGNVGVVTNLLSSIPLSPKNTIVFICGPEVMMRFTAQLLLARGIQKSSIYLSMERNMKCATGHCGHCQWGPEFICKDGPVFQYEKVEKWFQIRAL